MKHVGHLIAAMVLLTASAVWGQISSDVAARIAEAEKLQNSGRSAEAERAYEAVVPALRGHGPSTELGSVLTSLSHIASSKGDYDQAISWGKEATRVFQRIGNTAGEARAWNNIGVAHLFRGDYGAAADEFEKTIALARQSADSKTQVQALNNRGVVSLYQAHYFEALEWYRNARVVLGSSTTADWYPNLWQITLFNEATVYQKLGNDQHALDVYRELERNLKALTPSDQAHLNSNLGVVYRRLGDPDKALKAYRAAQGLYGRERDVDGELGVLKNIGIVQALDLQHMNDALQTFDEAAALATRTNNRRELLQARLYHAETLLRLGRIGLAEREFQAALELARTLQAAEETWKALYGLGRTAEAQGSAATAESRYRDAIAAIESVRAGLQLAALKTDFFGDKRIVYDALVRMLLAKRDIEGVFEILERSRARNFQDLLHQQAKIGSGTSLKAVQQRLSDDALLIEYWVTEDRIAAVWITHTSFGVSNVVSSSTAVQSLARLARDLPGFGAEWRKRTQSLTALLSGIEPVRGNTIQHVIVVPDGFVASLPLELAVPAGDAQLLIERSDVTYVPSALLLLRETTRQYRWRLPWQEQLAGFGDPTAGTGSPSSSSSALLPDSGRELANLAALSTGRARLYAGGANLKRTFLTAASPRAPLLHISTHAVADFEAPERSRLLFSPASPNGSNDYVFLKELYDANFAGVELATLSACDTEAGRLVRGEGVQAFSRALLSRGARSAVTTLWRVDDRPTAEFMRQFYYFLLVKHESRAEALRAAKLTFLRSGTTFSEPQYWAAFVLNGEGATPLPHFLGWPMLAIAAIFFIGGTTAMALWVWRRLRQDSGGRHRDNEKARVVGQ